MGLRKPEGNGGRQRVKTQDWITEERVEYRVRDYRDLDPGIRNLVEAVAHALEESPEKIEFLLEVPPKEDPWARRAFMEYLDTLTLPPGIKEEVREQAERFSAPKGKMHLVAVLLLGPGMREVASLFLPLEG